LAIAFSSNFVIIFIVYHILPLASTAKPTPKISGLTVPVICYQLPVNVQRTEFGTQ
jgi:hypothetical protein